MKFPTLYTTAKTGAVHQWSVATQGDKVIVQHGQVGGVLTTATTVATPKNQGRSNETTGAQQAEIEAQALHTFKLARTYSLTPEAAKETVLLPMLAHPLSKYEHKVTYPVLLNPKLDGCRCIAKWDGDKVVLGTRGGKVWTATPHINRELETVLPKGTVLDGELYIHGKAFQWLTSRVKKAQAGSEQIELHVYDMPVVEGDDSLNQKERQDALDLFFAQNAMHNVEYIMPVEAFLSYDKKDVQWQHDQFVKDGYEGAIIRLLDGVYEWGHRSQSLLKLKSFNDGEYKVVGSTHGEGIETDLVIWICEGQDGKTFATRPRGTHEERRELLLNAASYYGRLMTIRYFGLTDDGLPRFPVGVGFRAAEDMD